MLYSIRDFSFTYPFSSNKIKITGHIEINQGDVVLVNGISGSGKSTLLYALKGLLPDVIFGDMAGEILYNGVPINTLSVLEKLKIGFVQQNPDSQIINREVFQELSFGLENLALSPEKIKEKIYTITKRFKLDYLLHRDTNTLSGGEKQRLVLLSIIMTNPDVILLDEPTAFLDSSAAQQFMQLLYEVRQNKTIIIIEHNIHYVKDIINRYFKIDTDGVVKEFPISELDKQSETDKFVENHERVKFDIQAIHEYMPLLQIKNLSYSYTKTHQVLDNVNITVYSKHILGVIGKSGVGKSTLFKIIARLIKTKNKIWLNNTDIFRFSNKEFYSQVGLLFQNPENHFLYSSVAQELKNDAQLLSEFNLHGSTEQNPFTLSEGQKRRLSFAILKQSFNRKLYLLDEPTFGQDFRNKSALVDLIRQMRDIGASFIIVSHDYNFVNAVCDNIVELD